MYLFLVNPEAGNKQFGKIRFRMETALDKLNIKHRFVMIENLADIDNLLAENLKPTYSGVAVVGGNATVNAVINGLVDEKMPMLIVPMSRTNYLAHSLGLSNWETAIRSLVNPEYKAHRLGKIGKHYFVGRIEVASHQNIISKYLRKSNLLVNFLGLNQVKPIAEHAVKTVLTLDDSLKVSSWIHKITISLLEEGEHKLKLELLSQAGEEITTTKLFADKVDVESDRKMPVLVGNETAAHTPAEIKAMSKHINLIVPKSNKLTA